MFCGGGSDIVRVAQVPRLGCWPGIVFLALL